MIAAIFRPPLSDVATVPSFAALALVVSPRYDCVNNATWRNALQLAEINRRTNLPIVRLRYVLDNKIVKGLERASEGRGTPRDFSPGDSFLIALAATLLENGFGAPLAKGFIGRIISDKATIKFSTLPEEGEVQILQLAGIFYGRLLTSRDSQTYPPSWQDTRTRARLDPTYSPLAFVSVDLAELRRRLFGG